MSIFCQEGTCERVTIIWLGFLGGYRPAHGRVETLTDLIGNQGDWDDFGLEGLG